MTSELLQDARFLLRHAAPKITGDELARYLADPTRAATASLLALIALDDASSLDDDASFALAHAVNAAFDRVSLDECERALVAAFPPPDHYDANEHDAIDIKVVVHPEHGVGIVELEIPESSSGDWRARVRFREGERVFAGDAARWTHPRKTFEHEASLVLSSRIDRASEDAFWTAVDAIGWDTGRPIDELAAELAARISYVECIGLHRRAFTLGFALKKRIEDWETAAGVKLPCGDDSFGDLVHHIIGLGRASYAQAMETPVLAMQRAEARDYRESFTYVFQNAQDRYPLAELERVLRDRATDVIIEHPQLGVGIPLRDATIAFATRVVRASNIG